MTFTDFLTTNKIKFVSTPIANRTDGIACKGMANHWKFTFKRGRKQMSGQFSGGSAVTSITPDNVLACLALDATFYDSEPEDDPTLVNACRKTGRKLVKFLGEEKYNQLLECTED